MKIKLKKFNLQCGIDVHASYNNYAGIECDLSRVSHFPSNVFSVWK